MAKVSQHLKLTLNKDFNMSCSRDDVALLSVQGHSSKLEYVKKVTLLLCRQMYYSKINFLHLKYENIHYLHYTHYTVWMISVLEMSFGNAYYGELITYGVYRKSNGLCILSVYNIYST